MIQRFRLESGLSKEAGNAGTATEYLRVAATPGVSCTNESISPTSSINQTSCTINSVLFTVRVKSKPHAEREEYR